MKTTNDSRNAVKTFREQQGGITKFFWDRWEYEIAECAHRHVPRHTPDVLGVLWCTDTKSFAMGMEKLGGLERPIKEESAVQLLQCLKQMHDVGIIHNDTRLDNVGIRGCEKHNVACFFDFGQSYVLPGSVADQECPNAPHDQSHLWNCSFEDEKSYILDADPHDTFNYLRTASMRDLSGEEGDIIQLLAECAADADNPTLKKILHAAVAMKETGRLNCDSVIEEFQTDTHQRQ
jgi:hypothetical protein